MDKRTLLEQHLARTSRTFALTIPLLPPEDKWQLTIAYLIMRIADTIEDGTWTAQMKIEALRQLSELLQVPDPDTLRSCARAWTEEPPMDNQDYLALMQDMPILFEEYGKLPELVRKYIARQTQEMITGMIRYIRDFEDGRIELTTMGELQDYCYYAAGVVGILCTFIFRHNHPTEVSPNFAQLLDDASTFGEALQLVNILKDQAEDEVEGRRFIGPDVDVGQVYLQARAYIQVGQRYTRRLFDSGAPKGVVGFCALPLLLASEALAEVEQHGPGAKVERARVMEIAQQLAEDLQRDEWPFASREEELAHT